MYAWSVGEHSEYSLFGVVSFLPELQSTDRQMLKDSEMHFCKCEMATKIVMECFHLMFIC